MSELAYRSEGRGAPLVLIHGVGGDSGNWGEIVPQLASSFRVVCPDLRGHGDSPPIRAACSVTDLAGDVVRLMDRLDVREAGVAGFSLGGQVAQSIALDYPERVRKLAIISTIAGRTESERAGAMSRVQLMAEKGLAAIAEANRERWFTEEFQRRCPEKVQARIDQLMKSDAESYLQAFTVFARDDLGTRLGDINAPTVIITGEHDAAAPPRMARLMHERIAGSTLHILPGLRHSLLIESPMQIAELLFSFFSSANYSTRA